MPDAEAARVPGGLCTARGIQLTLETPLLNASYADHSAAIAATTAGTFNFLPQRTDVSCDSRY
jgi:hypothetical protein